MNENRDRGSAPEKADDRGSAPEKADDRRESGLPGGGAGRKDEVGGSGVYPASAGKAPEGAEIRTPAAWGQGDRGAAGYEDSGESELFFYEAELRAAGIDPKDTWTADRNQSKDEEEEEETEQPGGDAA
ncbi:MAG: hypothetical protein ACREK1_01215 [Longimicrobiales bacterium]